MDLSERQAKLNTELRFHNYKLALPLAYALRLELELLNNPTEKQLKQLEEVRLRVRQLEVLTRPLYAKIAHKMYQSWVAPDPEEANLPSLKMEVEAASTSFNDEEDR